MIRTLCSACLFTCAIASGQSFVSAGAAGAPAPNPSAGRSIIGTARLPQFDAVSIKPALAQGQQMNAIYAYPNGRIFCSHCTLQFLSTLAFDLREWQIKGGEDWNGLASTIPYDINATAPEGSYSYDTKAPLSSQQRQMLQSLLINRFRLAGHLETRSDTVYILQKGDQPLKLVPPLHPNETHWAGGPGGGPIGSTPGIAGKNISMSELAVCISATLKGPVIDQTLLPGRFDFQFRPNDPSANTGVNEGILASIRGIGLKLTPATGPVVTLVIDHAEPPTQE